MDFNPIPFFISFVILSSIYHILYAEYIRLRRETYNFWVEHICYGQFPSSDKIKKNVCARAEAMSRELCQSNNLVSGLSLIIFINVIFYKLYYQNYMDIPLNHTSNVIILNKWIFGMMIVILITMLGEYLYLRIGIYDEMSTFKKFTLRAFRWRDEPEDRLKAVWSELKCRDVKVSKYDKNKMPKSFYE